MPHRTWPSLVLPGTFPLMKCTFCWSACPSSALWPPFNGNFPLLPCIPACLALCCCHSGACDSCPEQWNISQWTFVHECSYARLPLLDWLLDCLGNKLPDLLNSWSTARKGWLSVGSRSWGWDSDWQHPADWRRENAYSMTLYVVKSS